MRYLVDNETVAETLKKIGLKPVKGPELELLNSPTARGSYTGFYKALFKTGPGQWDYLYRGCGYIKNFDEVIKYIPKGSATEDLKRLPNKNVSLYDIPFSFSSTGTESIINHYPNTRCITNKANLLKILRDSDLDSVLPLTFNLGDPVSVSDFEMTLLADSKGAKHWIYKPEYMYAGKGIQLISPGPETAGITTLKNGIIQEYEMNPLTIPGPDGPRKIDFRVMVMMVGPVSHGQGRALPCMFFSPIPFIRTSGYAFKKSFNIPNPEYVHITNQSFQKDSSNFGKYEEGNILIGLDILDLTVNQKQFIESEFKRIIKLVLTSSLSCIGKGNKPNRFRPFEIFGFDFLVLDENRRFQVKLLEVNDNAGMEWNNKEADQLGKDMIEEAVLLSLVILEGGNIGEAKSRLWSKL